jgi:hypothetical protein
VADQIYEKMVDAQLHVYDPPRGDIDTRACEQVVTNGGYFGPWLEV